MYTYQFISKEQSHSQCFLLFSHLRAEGDQSCQIGRVSSLWDDPIIIYAMSAPTDLIFDLVKAEEIPDALLIEQQGQQLPQWTRIQELTAHTCERIPTERSCEFGKVQVCTTLSDVHFTTHSTSSYRYRQEQAPDLFLGAFIPQEGGNRKIIGYICSTLSPSETLTHDSMSVHIPGASTVCIHAICVEKSFQRKGIATRLLKEYVSRLRARAEAGSVPYEKIVLISHDNLIPFYENAGFKNLGKSDVVHGSLPWYELRVDLKDSSGTSTTSASGTTTSTTASTISAADVRAMPPAQQGDQEIPAGLWEALLRGSSTRNKPTGKLLSSFENGLGDVIASTTQGTSVNKFDLLCPRPECGSIILKGGVAKWVERASEQASIHVSVSVVRATLMSASSSPPASTT